MAIARWLETDSLSNQDISSAVSIGAYTADADRMVVVDVSLDAVAGNGDYVIYVTRQINGAGSAYVLLPKTTCAAASGETAIAMQSGMISVRSGDVLTVYVDGLAGDTATPDTVVRWFELAALRPTTADRTLDVSAGGEAGLDWANVGSPTTSVGLSNTTVGLVTTVLNLTNAPAGMALEATLADMKGADWTSDGTLVSIWSNTDNLLGSLQSLLDSLGAWTGTGVNNILGAFKALLSKTASTPSDIGGTFNPATDSIEALRDRGDAAWATADVSGLAQTGADGDTLKTLSDQLDAIGGGAGGSGAISYPITVQDEDSNPIDGVEVWITTDSAGTNVVAGTLSTDALGVATFMLDAGDYYVWRQRSGYNFTNPVAITVS